MKTDNDSLKAKSPTVEDFSEIEQICKDFRDVTPQVPQQTCLHRMALLNKLHNIWVNADEVLVVKADNRDVQISSVCGDGTVAANQKNTSEKVEATKVSCFSSTNDDTSDKYRCAHCGKVFKRLTALRCHEASHSTNNLELTINGGDISIETSSPPDSTYLLSEPFKGHPRNHKSPLVCSVCNKEFSQKSKLAQHLSAHSSDQPYACDMCSSRYSKSAALQRHLLSHTGERPFKCDQCHLTYRNKESLKQHYLKHSGTNPYQCEHCEMKTFDRGTLTKHMRTHTGERPYICNCCGHGFKTSDTLKMHLRTHTGEKPYKCEVCGKAFAYKSNMKSHKKRHTGERPHKCATCNQDFVDMTSYKIHMRRHTGEKPYTCQECNKQFAHSSGLYAHLKIHSGQRPFKCSKCDTNFVRLAHLKKHVERIHKISGDNSSSLTTNGT